MTYEREKSMYELIEWCKKDYPNKKDFDDSKCVQYVKRQVRQLAKENHKDSISQPLTEEKRFIHHGECGEYWSEYYIIPCQATEQEIQQYIGEQRIEIHSMYDCTGKPFTRYITANQTKCGVAVVHAKALDV